MERRSFLGSAGALSLGALAATAPVAQAQTGGSTRLALPVTGSSVSGNMTGALVGTFTPTEVVRQGSRLQMQGLLNLSLINEAGQLTQVISNELVTLPMNIQQASCTILDLQLGPLDLNLLGLRIQLSQIDLVITAIPGGGLLGDLLCGIANLLNGSGQRLGQLLNLLNQLLGLFR